MKIFVLIFILMGSLCYGADPYLEFRGASLSCELREAFPQIEKFRKRNGVRIPLSEFRNLKNVDMFLAYERYPLFILPLLEASPHLLLGQWSQVDGDVSVKTEWHDVLPSREITAYGMDLSLKTVKRNYVSETTFDLTIPASMVPTDLTRQFMEDAEKIFERLPTGFVTVLPEEKIDGLHQKDLVRRYVYKITMPDRLRMRMYVKTLGIFDQRIRDFVQAINKPFKELDKGP
jgi:hypothetical protein